MAHVDAAIADALCADDAAAPRSGAPAAAVGGLLAVVADAGSPPLSDVDAVETFARDAAHTAGLAPYAPFVAEWTVRRCLARWIRGTAFDRAPFPCATGEAAGHAATVAAHVARLADLDALDAPLDAPLRLHGASGEAYRLAGILEVDDRFYDLFNGLSRYLPTLPGVAVAAPCRDPRMRLDRHQLDAAGVCAADADLVDRLQVLRAGRIRRAACAVPWRRVVGAVMARPPALPAALAPLVERYAAAAHAAFWADAGPDAAGCDRVLTLRRVCACLRLRPRFGAQAGRTGTRPLRVSLSD
jgi:hypothetical protein